MILAAQYERMGRTMARGQLMIHLELHARTWQRRVPTFDRQPIFSSSRVQHSLSHHHHHHSTRAQPVRGPTHPAPVPTAWRPSSPSPPCLSSLCRPARPCPAGGWKTPRPCRSRGRRGRLGERCSVWARRAWTLCQDCVFLLGEKLRCKRKCEGDFTAARGLIRGPAQITFLRFRPQSPWFQSKDSIFKPTSVMSGPLYDAFLGKSRPCRLLPRFILFLDPFSNRRPHFQTGPYYQINAQSNVHSSYVQHNFFMQLVHIPPSPTNLSASSIYCKGFSPATLSKLSRPTD